MASPAKIYQSEIHGNLGFFPNWLPGNEIEIGDVGVLEEGRFRRVSSLGSLRIPFATKKASTSTNLQYTSTSGTRVSLGAGGALQGAAAAEINVDFSQNGAFVFQVHGLREERLQDFAAVAAGMVDAYEHGRWEKKWVLVESLYTAEVATIVVSQDQSAGLVLEAKAEGPISSVSLADPKVNLTVKSTRGKLVHVIGGRRTRPLYLCSRVKDPLLGASRVEPVRGGPASPSLGRVSRPSLDDLLNS